MKPRMTRHVEEYLTVRRALGVQLRIEGGQLREFARYADALGHRGPITVDLVARWARSSSRSTPVGWARRAEVVRPFAKYRLAFDPRTEIPPSGLLGRAHPRRPPHIYSMSEIRRMLAEARRLHPVGGLRPAAVHVLLGLLACTGMRPAEPLRLTRGDVDLDAGVLTIRLTKFRKTRLVPLHFSATNALRRYARLRDDRVSEPVTPNFFVVDGGFPLTQRRLHHAFLGIRLGMGWRAATGGRLPRLYDLRHTFACRRLLRWYSDGVDVQQALPSLSTYLGHVKVSDTYWYLTGIPELMALTAARFERFARGGRR
jgi:integrase